MRLRGVIGVVAVGVIANAWSCGSSNTQEPKPVTFVDHVYSCKGDIDQAPTLVEVPAVDAGRKAVLRKGEETLLGMGINPDAVSTETKWRLGGIVSSREIRRRAALICACRAQANRKNTKAGSWSDILTVGGTIGVVGGGAINGIAAATKDDNKRQKVQIAGISALGVGGVLFAINAAMNLAQRAQEHVDSAGQQEIAAAVLLNDKAKPEDWGRAWMSCVTASNGSTLSRLSNPESAFGNGDAGLSTEAAPPLAPEQPQDAGTDAPAE